MNIAEYLHLNATYSSGSGIGNPWHGPDGKFTNGPAGAFGATKVYTASECPVGSDAYRSAAFSTGAANYTFNDNVPITSGEKDADGNTIISDSRFSDGLTVVSKKFTPDIAAAVETSVGRANEISSEIDTASPTKEIHSVLKSSIYDAKQGSLQPEQLKVLNKIISTKSRSGSKLEKAQKLANDIKGVNNTMKYIKDKIQSEGIAVDYEKIGNRTANLNDYHITQGGKVLSNAKFIKNGEVVVKYRNSEKTNRDYFVSSSDKRTGDTNNIQLGTMSTSGEPYISTSSGAFSSTDRVKAGAVTASKSDITAGQTKMFADYQKAYSKWLNEK